MYIKNINGESMNSCELVTLVSSLACCIAKDRTIDEIAQLSSFLVLLGDNLDLIATNMENCEKKSKDVVIP